LFCSLASIDFALQDDSSSSSSLEFNKGSPESFELIKQRQNSAECNYQLLRQLAEAIYGDQFEETKEVSYVPDLVSRVGKQKDNPIDICIVYLREKIAQSQGLVDAIDQR
jgi:hypothetical protein